MPALPSTYEPIMNALFAKLQSELVPTPFTYASRRLLMWEELIQSIQSGVAPILQPSFFLYDGMGFGGGRTEFKRSGRRTEPIRVLHRTIVIYARFPGADTPSGADTTTAGGTIFAPLSEAVEGVLQETDREGVQTLGGLVSHVWIEGDSHWVTPDIVPQGQGMLTIPVQIMIP